MNTSNHAQMRKIVVRIAEAEQLIGVSKSTIWARANPKSDRYDPDFPAIFPLHSNPSGRGAVGMFLEDIQDYLKKNKDRTINRHQNSPASESGGRMNSTSANFSR